MRITFIFVLLSLCKAHELLWPTVAQMAYCALTGVYSLCYDLCNNPPCLNMQGVMDESCEELLHTVLWMNLMFH